MNLSRQNEPGNRVRRWCSNSAGRPDRRGPLAVSTYGNLPLRVPLPFAPGCRVSYCEDLTPLGSGADFTGWYEEAVRQHRRRARIVLPVPNARALRRGRPAAEENPENVIVPVAVEDAVA